MRLGCGIEPGCVEATGFAWSKGSTQYGYHVKLDYGLHLERVRRGIDIVSNWATDYWSRTPIVLRPMGFSCGSL